MTLAEQFREEGRREGREEGRREGREEGRREGREEGRREGRQLVLRCISKRRFGELPGWAEAKLTEGTLDELEQWADRIFDAAEIEDVFA